MVNEIDLLSLVIALNGLGIGITLIRISNALNRIAEAMKEE